MEQRQRAQIDVQTFEIDLCPSAVGKDHREQRREDQKDTPGRLGPEKFAQRRAGAVEGIKHQHGETR